MIKRQDEKDIPIDFPEEEVKTTEQNESSSGTDGEASAKSKAGEKEKKRGTDYKKLYQELNQKYEALNDQYLRLRAEFANYKRRVEREQLELADYIKGEFMKKLLPVLDDFNHMLEKSQQGANEQSVLEGAKMIYDKFYQILRSEGLEKIEALGQEFDPQIHEAMMMQKTDNRDDHHKVLNVFQDGYKIKDKLIRASKVVVGTFEEETDNK